MPRDTIAGVRRRDPIHPAPTPALLQFLEHRFPIDRIIQDDLSDHELRIAIGEQRVLAELRRLLEAAEEAQHVSA